MIKGKRIYQTKRNIIYSGSKSVKNMVCAGKTENLMKLIDNKFCVSFAELPKSFPHFLSFCLALLSSVFHLVDRVIF